MPSLYQIDQYTQAAIEKLNAMEGDVSEVVIRDTIEAVKGELNVKRQSVAAYIKNTMFDIEAMKQYKKNMDNRIKKAESLIERLKSSLLWSMEKSGDTKVESSELTIYLKNNPPCVVVNNEDLIPHEYMREIVKYDPDKDRIKNALKLGVDIPGAHLETKKRIEIK